MDDDIIKRGGPRENAGRKPLSDVTKDFRLILPISYHEYLQERAKEKEMSMAEYMRRLILADMRQQSEE